MDYAILGCSIEGCIGPVRSRGLCNKHYLRLVRRGSPISGRTFANESRQWLDNHVNFAGDECLPFPYGKFAQGYGVVTASPNKQTHAHRYMCEKAHGPAPSENLETCHSCGNPECVNPRHLRWDTHTGNMGDKIWHGTLLFGENHPSRKLSKAQALEIFQRAWGGEQSTKIAEEFGISCANVSMIKYGNSWRKGLGSIEEIKPQLAAPANNVGVKRLTRENVLTIRSMIEAKVPMKEIAKSMGVSYGRVTAINRGESYAEVQL